MAQHINSDGPFSWLSSYGNMSKASDNMYVSSPETISIVQIYMSPSYTINKVNQRRVQLVDGVPDEESTPTRVSSQEGTYRLVDAFRYTTQITNEQQIEEQSFGTIENLGGFDFGNWPSSISAMHRLNTLYLLYQQSSLRRRNEPSSKTRRHVRFATASKKTRRLLHETI